VTGIDGGSCEFTPLLAIISITDTHLSVDPTKSSTFDDILPGNFSSVYADGSGVTGDYFTDQFSVADVTVNNLRVSYSDSRLACCTFFTSCNCSSEEGLL
jgi:hypothetical protein